jgi:ribose 5-phosphate isomerase RpiB
MRIAVVTEISTLDKNKDVLQTLKSLQSDVINAGMREEYPNSVLTYIDTAFISALLINTGRVELVVGGCGTGQGYLNALMQYPNMFCGLIQEPLDAWLFAQINGGNAISLALNKGYGWAGDINLAFIFEKLFSTTFGCGYPKERQASQKESREMLKKMSAQFRKSFDEIILSIDEVILQRVFAYPGMMETIDPAGIKDEAVKNALLSRLDKLDLHK